MILSFDSIYSQATLTGLAFQLLSVFLIWDTVRVPDREIHEAGAGAILGSKWDVLGVRAATVMGLVRRQYDSLVGLGMLVTGIVVQMVAMNLPPAQSPVAPALFLAGLLFIFIFAKWVARRIAIRCYMRRIAGMFRDRIDLWRRNGMSPDKDDGARREIRSELEGLLSDTCTQAEIDNAFQSLFPGEGH